jgi:hypothetical protein
MKKYILIPLILFSTPTLADPPAQEQKSLPLTLSGEDVDSILTSLQISELEIRQPKGGSVPFVSSGARAVSQFLQNKEKELHDNAKKN